VSRAAAKAAPQGLVPGMHRTDPLTDVALTLPIFLAYHVGVVFLPVRNAADVVTSRLAALADHSRAEYVGLTLGLGAAVTLLLLLFGQREKLKWESFAMVAIEGVLYAMAMRTVASIAVGYIPLGPGAIGQSGTFTSVVMALGAGFYEEMAFRVALFGLGAKFLLHLDDWPKWIVYPVWGVVCAAGFSFWHHVGPMGEPFELKAFVFRTVCGLTFTAIFALRGFAPAVWTHTLYDVWVMVF
jgi:hypothetical protein